MQSAVRVSPQFSKQVRLEGSIIQRIFRTVEKPVSRRQHRIFRLVLFHPGKLLFHDRITPLFARQRRINQKMMQFLKLLRCGARHHPRIFLHYQIAPLLMGAVHIRLHAVYEFLCPRCKMASSHDKKCLRIVLTRSTSALVIDFLKIFPLHLNQFLYFLLFRHTLSSLSLARSLPNQFPASFLSVTVHARSHFDVSIRGLSFHHMTFFQLRILNPFHDLPRMRFQKCIPAVSQSLFSQFPNYRLTDFLDPTHARI